MITKTQFRHAIVAFSLPELLATLCVLALLVTIAVLNLGSARSFTRSTKLTADVHNLNSIVNVYRASGGSLDGITDPQVVLNHLKSVLVSAEKSRNVGVMTGSGVDLRLVARLQSSDESGSSEARAWWDSAHQQFAISSKAGTPGISSFELDSRLADFAVSTEARDHSNLLFNGSSGWVWACADSGGAPSILPSNPNLVDQENRYNPLAGGPGSTGSPSSTPPSTTPETLPPGNGNSSTGNGNNGPPGTTPPGPDAQGASIPALAIVPLPSPIISPPGGMFYKEMFPNLVYINPNGAPVSSSVLKYRLNNDTWRIYTGPFTVTSQTQVTAQNFSSNSALFLDSPSAVETYYVLVSGFSGNSFTRWGLMNTNGGVTNMKNGDNIHGTNSLSLDRVPTFQNALPNAPFRIAQVNYHRGAISANNATPTVILHVDIDLTSPVVASIGIDIPLLIGTPSSPQSNEPDTLNLPSPISGFKITIDGVIYTLRVGFGSADSPGSFGSTASVMKGSAGNVDLLGVFVSETPAAASP